MIILSAILLVLWVHFDFDHFLRSSFICFVAIVYILSSHCNRLIILRAVAVFIWLNITNLYVFISFMDQLFFLFCFRSAMIVPINKRLFFSVLKEKILPVKGKTIVSPGYTAVMSWQSIPQGESVPQFSPNQKCDIQEVRNSFKTVVLHF